MWCIGKMEHLWPTQKFNWGKTSYFSKLFNHVGWVVITSINFTSPETGSLLLGISYSNVSRSIIVGVFFHVKKILIIYSGHFNTVPPSGLCFVERLICPIK